MFSIVRYYFVLVVMSGLFALNSKADNGPDPVAYWNFSSKDVKAGQLISRLGPDGKFSQRSSIVDTAYGQAAVFSGKGQYIRFTEKFVEPHQKLPRKNLTVAAWVSVDKGESDGGIIGALSDGVSPKGWLLGYDEEVFTFSMASVDGAEKVTCLKGKTKFQKGQFYHVVVSYDGLVISLYVDGKLEATSDVQSGDILYSESAPFEIGRHKDSGRVYWLDGKVQAISIYGLAAKAKWVSQIFTHQESHAIGRHHADSHEHAHETHHSLSYQDKAVASDPLKVIVAPFLQYGTTDSMIIVWRTNQKSKGTVHWGPTSECKNKSKVSNGLEIHQIRLNKLEANTQYFYRAESKLGNGKSILSEVKTFQTAVEKGTPFAFAVISDTQGNPKVSGTLAKYAWAQRPNFLLIPGDLVSTGSVHKQWVDQYFKSMEPLISRVPFFPQLGNHERNAKHYFDYMALPDPEYYYKFTYGNTDFFMIDTNRKVHKGSEQYQWLEKELKKSKATWKIVSHHHPPYSSDENDYGNLWKTNKSTRGYVRTKALIPLYEKYKVDIVWTGHIHSYERTWPILKGKAVNNNGVRYLITGGGGGGLETPGPYRPFFQNNVMRGHHYSMMYVNGNQIEFKAYDLENKLFDTFKIEKNPKSGRSRNGR